MSTEQQSASEPFILFELAGTTYGLRSEFVQQIVMIEDIAALPNAPAAVAGVVFVRGQVVTAMDLRVRFGFEPIERDLRSRLIVTNHDQRVVGLIVDSAREFVRIPATAIEPTPQAITGLSGQYLAGIASIKDRLILILNLEAVLRIDEEIVSVEPA
jgi:purine-binding chemotaxis protein CheW